MTQYYFHDGQKEQGPYNIEELKALSLKKDTPIWYEGLQSWTTAGEVEELKQKTPPPLSKPIQSQTPPKLEQTNQFHSTVPEYEQTQSTKKSYTLPLIIAALIIIGSIAGWLIYQNSKRSETINTLQEKVTTQDQTISTQQGVLTEQQNAEAERQRINAANTVKNKNYRNNWSDYISVTTNRYSYREIGGVFGVEIIVTNKTEYMLDEVEAQVGYVKSTGDYFKTETVTIYNVPANSSKTSSAPDSERGKSVELNINSIVSKKMHFCYAPGTWAKNSDDPYFCK